MADEKTAEELEEEEKAKADETEKAEEEAAKPDPPAKKEEAAEVVEEDEPESAPANNVDELKAAHLSAQKEIKRLDSIIKQQVDVKLGTLSEEDKELVLDLAGKKPDAQLAMIAKLEAKGKITSNGTASGSAPVVPPPGDRTRVAGEDAAASKPDTWKDADQRVSKKLALLKR